MTDAPTRLYPETASTLLPCPLCQSGNVQLGACWIGERKLSEEPAARCMDCGCRATKGAWQARGVAQSPFTPELMNQTTVSCSGKEITIQCNNHKVKDALMDILIDGAYALSSTDRVTLPGHDETMANLDALTISSTDRLSGLLGCRRCGGWGKMPNFGATCDLCHGTGNDPDQSLSSPQRGGE